MRSGSVQEAPVPTSLRCDRLGTAACLAIGLVLVTVSPTAAHSLIDISVEIPRQCPNGEDACLQTSDHQPSLHAGESLHLYAYNDDDQTHELHVTTASRQDTQSEGTSTEQALVSTGTIAPNTSVDAGEFTIPADAESLYVWCSRDGHEAAGEHLTLALEPPHDAFEEDEGRDRDIPGASPLAPAGVLLFVGLVHRGRRPH